MTNLRSASSVEPRGLSHANAAAYVGVSPGAFLVLVSTGLMPTPTIIGPYLLWDRLAIDRHFDAASAKPLSAVEWKDVVTGTGVARSPAENQKVTNSDEPTGPKKRGPTIKTFDQMTTDELLHLSAEERKKSWKKSQEVFAEEVRTEPMYKLERVALWELFRKQGETVHSQQMWGVSDQIQKRLVGRGYVKFEGAKDRFWRITKAGIDAIKGTPEEQPPKASKTYY